MNHDPGPHDQALPTPFWRSRYAAGLLMFGAAALYFLLKEHRAHFFGALPFLVLLACPLMHVFMHGGHGSHGRHGGGKQAADRPADKSGAQP